MKWQCKTGSSKGELQAIKTAALEVLQNWGIDSEMLFEFNLILCELLANAAEHGNNWESTKKVSLYLQFLPKKKCVLLLICDEGRKGIKKPRHPSVTAEKGRGLILVEALAKRCQRGYGRIWVRKGIVDGEKDPDN